MCMNRRAFTCLCFACNVQILVWKNAVCCGRSMWVVHLIVKVTRRQDIKLKVQKCPLDLIHGQNHFSGQEQMVVAVTCCRKPLIPLKPYGMRDRPLPTYHYLRFILAKLNFKVWVLLWCCWWSCTPLQGMPPITVWIGQVNEIGLWCSISLRKESHVPQPSYHQKRDPERRLTTTGGWLEHKNSVNASGTGKERLEWRLNHHASPAAPLHANRLQEDAGDRYAS